jgi:ankyrin repeat protein
MKKYQTLSCLLVLHGYVIHAAEEVKEVVDVSVQDQKDLNDQLLHAIQIQDMQKIVKALAAGADINASDARGWTILMEAVSIGNVDIVDILLENQADVHAQNNHGYNVFMLAALQGKVAILERLYAKGALINIQNFEGQTALMLAAAPDHIIVLDFLIRKGADIDISDNKGFTALIDAAESASLQSVLRLIDAGAHINAHDKEDRTALIVALEMLYDAISSLGYTQSMIDKYRSIIAALIQVTPILDSSATMLAINGIFAIADHDERSRAFAALITELKSYIQVGIGLK